jgi:hypothetical protein
MRLGAPALPRWFVPFLFLPMILSVACATSAGRARLDQSRPQIGSASDARGQRAAKLGEPIEPDRPDVTNGTHIVDVGLLQLETGMQHVRMGSSQRNFGTPLSIRVGLTEWLEARVGTDGFLRQTTSASSVSGPGNVQAGAKLRLFADPGGVPVLSILPTLNLPVASASKGLGSGDFDLTLALLTGTDLGKTSHIDFNYGIGAIGAGQGRPHFVQHLLSVSFSHSVTEQLSPYVEGFWFSKQDPDGGRVVSIDAGLIHAISARLAVDGGVALGLTEAAPALSLFGGISVIVGDVLGDHGVLARERRAARLLSRPR